MKNARDLPFVPKLQDGPLEGRPDPEMRLTTAPVLPNFGLILRYTSVNWLLSQLIWLSSHPMRLRLSDHLQWTTRFLMFAAALAFVQHGALVAVSQARAAAGSPSGPAVAVSGPVHLHGNHAGILHLHGGDTASGHVHGTAGHDHHDMDETGAALSWSLGCTAAVMPVMDGIEISADLGSALRGVPQDRMEGTDPDGLQRPPSTPGIV